MHAVHLLDCLHHSSLLSPLSLPPTPKRRPPLPQGHPTSRLNSTAAGPQEGDEDAPELLADVDASMVDELLAHLNRRGLTWPWRTDSCLSL